MRPNAVILFTGDARREEAEKGLPRRFLARLHAELASVVRSLDEVDLYLASDAGEAFVIDGPAFASRAAQMPLGEKVDLAISRCFAAGYSRVAVVAGDVAGLTRELLVEAFASLTQTSSVVGKSPDGGFYLAAFSAPSQVAWSSLPWSMPDLYEALVGQLHDPHELPSLRDIDSLGDAFSAVRTIRDVRLRGRLLSILALHAPDVAPRALAPRLRPRGADRLRAPPAAA
jgi:glycosyltransferase A (GT-A) superfamily protein (DUF2064 family)